MKHLFLLGFVCVTACSAASEGTEVVPSPLESCSGKFHCTYRDRAFDSALYVEKGVCTLGGLALLPDGVMRSESYGDGTWEGDARHFTICDGKGDCRTCDAKTPPPAASSGGKCTGSPDSCSSIRPPNCSDIRGCHMVSHLRYDGSWDNECGGYADSCENMVDAEHCRRQGCEWK